MINDEGLRCACGTDFNVGNARPCSIPAFAAKQGIEAVKIETTE